MSNKINDIYSKYIFKSRYARYLPAEKRRETWDETCQRYIDFMAPPELLKHSERTMLADAIRSKDVMPSMRAMMTAGPAMARDNVAGYNCAYVPCDDKRVFDEIMYILMCGTGVGFSVERAYVSNLPTIATEFFDEETTIRIADSKVGWATAYRKLIVLLYEGLVPNFDYSLIRKAGSKLKTFGGRASGPEPLRTLIEYTIALFKGAKGRKLNELECHDLICKIAEVVVCGGVRRSALISLSNLTDQRLRNAKSGTWYYTEPHRALANNSVCYTEQPDVGMFLKEWTSLYESKSGERGIFSRTACEAVMPERRERGYDWGTNPCSEIILRPRQFCNLTEIIIKPTDDLDTLLSKAKVATILGTLQSQHIDFRYLSKKWQDNCAEERLLGVSLTGIYDHPEMREGNEEWLEAIKNRCIKVNKEWATRLGIPASAAITCVKPSGTVSQLTDTSSGIHPRYADYYLRRVRQDIKDPLSKALIDQGVPYELDNNNPSQYIFAFPIKSPSKEANRAMASAISQLELWKKYALVYCEHKPSMSCYVREHEWAEVASWVYKNFSILSGVSFFPYDDHIYAQAPYEELTKEAYDKLVAEFPKELDLDNIDEEEDLTTASQELACSGGSCEL